MFWPVREIFTQDKQDWQLITLTNTSVPQLTMIRVDMVAIHRKTTISTCIVREWWEKTITTLGLGLRIDLKIAIFQGMVKQVQVAAIHITDLAHRQQCSKVIPVILGTISLLWKISMPRSLDWIIPQKYETTATILVPELASTCRIILKVVLMITNMTLRNIGNYQNSQIISINRSMRR